MPKTQTEILIELVFAAHNGKTSGEIQQMARSQGVEIFVPDIADAVARLGNLQSIDYAGVCMPGSPCIFQS